MSNQPIKYSLSDFSRGDIVFRRKLVESDYRMHWHDCCELEVILSGSGIQRLNGVDYELSSGSIYLLTQADWHSIQVHEPLDVAGIMFDDNIISERLYERVLTYETLNKNLCSKLSGAGFRSVMGLLDALMGESGRGGDFGDMYACHIIECLIIEVLRCHVSSGAAIEKSPVSRAVLYLHRHFSEDITLDTLANLTHLSRSYFSELFRNATGHTFKSYLIDLRMRNACRLLANTDMSVTDVCFSCGFESFSNFMRTFKARIGSTPLGFRAGYKNIQE